MDALPQGFWPAAAIGTGAIVLFSWFISIRAKRYHGIARFFVFEGILVLTLLNLPVWFRDPFSARQIVSWILLIVSFALAIHSVFLYFKLSKPAGQFENSTRLVVTGAYRFIRHPMYGSLGLFGLGAFLKRVTLMTSIIAGIILVAVYMTARIEEGEMRARFGDEYRAYMRKTKMFVPFLFLFLAAFASLASAQPQPLIRYTVLPEPDGSGVTVEAEINLLRSPAYLKDFNQIESIQWFFKGKEIPVQADRQGDLLIFRGLPDFGEARAVYRLKCVTQPVPGYRKRLMGGPGFVMAREGLFLGFNGKEISEVEVAWRLPRDWTLALGREGVQRFSETQRTLWIAGKTAAVVSAASGDKTFRIAVMDGVLEDQAKASVEALKKIFAYASARYGEVDESVCGVAIFPHGALGGGTALYRTLAGEDRLPTVIHEMLHWWTNFLAPAWFREGAHDYFVLRILVDQGILPESAVKPALDLYLQERLRVEKREGKIVSLAEASEAYDAGKPAGDIYAYAPLFAAKLDREIRARRSDASLEQVFAEVCRRRFRPGLRSEGPARIDIPALIKELTGYDPAAFFEKYFSVPVEDAADLLERRLPAVLPEL